MANVVAFSHRLQDNELTNGTGVHNFMVNLLPPLTFLKNVQSCVLQTLEITVSDRACNIFNWKPWGVNFDNTSLRVGTDLLGFITINLIPGRYLTFEAIAAGVNATINTTPILNWWTNPDDPGILFEYSPTTKKAIIKLDSTKLRAIKGTQIYVDFRYSTTKSDLYNFFGLNAETLFDTDGTFTGPNQTNTSPQGHSIVVNCSLAPLRRFSSINPTKTPSIGSVGQATLDSYDAIDKAILASIPFVAQQFQYDIRWPSQGVKSPKMYLSVPPKVYNYRIWVTTSDGKPMVFSGGTLQGSLGFYQG